MFYFSSVLQVNMKKVAFLNNLENALSKPQEARNKNKKALFPLEFGEALSPRVQANNLDAVAGFCRLGERRPHGEAVRAGK